MATIGSQYFTFRDFLAGLKPNGEYDSDIIELMAEENAVLQDIPWKMCSKGREDTTTMRTGLPEAVMRMYYEGISGSKSTRRQVVNSCATVSTALEFDWRLYQDSKNKESFLTDEQRAHSDALGQAVAAALFYGDIALSPKGINGFAKTLSKYGSTATGSTVYDDEKASFYVYNAGGTAGHLRSAFLVGWGAKSAHGIYPENTSAGIDMGEVKSQYVPDSNGKKLLMGIQEMNWNIGLNIRDYRYCGRIGNIDLDKIFTAKGSTGYCDLVGLMRRMACRTKSEGVTQRMYMPRIVFEGIANQFYSVTAGNAIKYPDLEQKKDGAIMGIPVAYCDAMNIDETAITPDA